MLVVDVCASGLGLAGITVEYDALGENFRTRGRRAEEQNRGVAQALDAAAGHPPGPHTTSVTMPELIRCPCNALSHLVRGRC